VNTIEELQVALFYVLGMVSGLSYCVATCAVFLGMFFHWHLNILNDHEMMKRAGTGKKLVKTETDRFGRVDSTRFVPQLLYFK